MEFIKELLSYLKKSKKLSLLPLIIIIVVVAIVLYIAQTTVLGPLIYTFF